MSAVKLLESYPALKVKSKENVALKIQSLVNGGYDKLQFISNFDHTLTCAGVQCTWSVMDCSPLMAKEYTEKTNALRAKYIPIEQDPCLSYADKAKHMEEWFGQAGNLLKQAGIRREMFKTFVEDSNVQLRNDVKTMLDCLHDSNVPVLIWSEGVGDSLVQVLDHFDLGQRNNITVLSNFLAYEGNQAIGIRDKIIHTYCKDEHLPQAQNYFSKIRGRSNVILLGNCLGDLSMSNGVQGLDTVLKIGFLNGSPVLEKNLEVFLDNFDLVLVNDQTMQVPMTILNDILKIKRE